MGNVTQVTKGTGNVAFFDIRIQITDLAAANSVHKVGEVIGRTGELLDQLAIEIEGRSTVVTRNHNITVGAVEDHSYFCTTVGFGFQTTYFKDQTLIAKLVNADLSVGYITPASV